MDNLKKYSDIAATAGEDQNLIGWVANYGQTYSADNYDDAAYDWQYANSAGPGLPNFRTQRSPQSLYNDAMVAKGYNDYHSIFNAVEAQLKARGIDPSNPDIADRIRAVRTYIATEIGKDNEAFKLEWGDSDKTKFERRANFFEGVLNDRTFMSDHKDDPQVLGIAAYLALRNNIAGELMARRDQGGSRTLSADSNADLRAIYDREVQGLKDRSIAFGDWYDRYFGFDTVTL